LHEVLEGRAGQGEGERMNDVLDELREAVAPYRTRHPAVLAVEIGVQWSLLERAIKEIERLRPLAGAVSEGNGSFRAITRDLPRNEPKNTGC
jgi:hypothetical protein